MFAYFSRTRFVLAKFVCLCIRVNVLKVVMESPLSAFVAYEFLFNFFLEIQFMYLKFLVTFEIKLCSYVKVFT